MQIEEPLKPGDKKIAVFALGFRPFFLLAAISAIVLLIAWMAIFERGLTFANYYPGTYWHSHEMMFGYAVAVICGFLLTAVRNWTDLDVPRNGLLAGLVLLWLTARILPYFQPLVSAMLIAGIDLLLLPLLAWIVAVRVWKRKQYNNLIFSVLLLGMFLANLLMHLEFNHIVHDGAWYGQNMMLFLLMLIIMAMGGRVIPFFAERGVGITTRKWKFIEILSPITLVSLALGTLFLDEAFNSWLALLACLTQAIRLHGWYHRAIWKEPLVWVLIVGYAWLVISLALMFLAFSGILSMNLAWHGFTVGALGGITLGMMARVTLGHTGREMKLPGKMALSFVFFYIAAVIRVILPLIFRDGFGIFVMVSGVFWVLAFALFIFYFMPMLLSPRVDGRPG